MNLRTCARSEEAPSSLNSDPAVDVVAEDWLRPERSPFFPAAVPLAFRTPSAFWYSNADSNYSELGPSFGYVFSPLDVILPIFFCELLDVQYPIDHKRRSDIRQRLQNQVSVSSIIGASTVAG